LTFEKISNNELFIIPARGGSKRIPRKNIKLLAGKPLIYYAIETARGITIDDNICLSTDDDEIINCANDFNLKVPFKRPALLSKDTTSTYEVLLHAVNYYESIGRKYKTIVLLQPTSPFCTTKHIIKAFELYNYSIDMVVSVKKSSENIYYNMFKENNQGHLKKVNEECLQLNQNIYSYNGAIYIINVDSLKENLNLNFNKTVKYVMNEIDSIDIDTYLDWHFAEFLIEKKLVL
jgi:N-acylneuraminate cytidylyltransferase